MPSATISGSASFATTAGSAGAATSVLGSSQPNITSIGTLASLNVTGSLNAGTSTLTNLAVTTALTKAGQDVLTALDFTTGSGWTRLPNGLLLQYGTAFVNRRTYTTVSYPISFSSFSIAVCSGSTQSNGDGSQGAPGVVASEASYFQTFFGTDAGGSGIVIRWIAIGY